MSVNFFAKWNMCYKLNGDRREERRMREIERRGRGGCSVCIGNNDDNDDTEGKGRESKCGWHSDDGGDNDDNRWWQ